MISDVRKLLSEWLAHCDCEVWTHLPDDVNALPCIVVAQPTGIVDAQLYSLVVPVLVVARRIADAESQKELDDVTDRVLSSLEGQDCAVLRFDPEARTIAGQVYPIYRLDVAIGVVRC